MNRKPKDKVTIVCRYCGLDFKVKYGERDKKFCSKSCASKGMKRPKSIKSTSKCVICDNEFSHYGTRIVCSQTCLGRYMSQQRLGANNPAFNPENHINGICSFCNKDFKYTKYGLHKGQIRRFCSLRCAHGGNKNYPTQVIRTDTYPSEFNENLKETIRERDGRVCLLCGENESSEKLSIHHIDYDKENITHNNLISLCRTCHSITNGQRSFWQTFFKTILSASKLVQKTWGAEVHVVNHQDYCLKYLIVYQDSYLSNHYHIIKKEAWHCLVGEFEVILTSPNDKQDYLIFNEGDKLEIEPGVVHQIRANRHSILVEVSTQSFPEDSYKDKPNLLV